MKRAAVLFAILAACAGAPASRRYVMTEDLGSRYHFKFVFDRETKRWANRECELRVDAARDLSGELSVQQFKSGSVSSAYIQPAGNRVWRILHAMDRDDLTGRVAYGVQLAHPDPGRETRHETMELFRLPAIVDQRPGEWSEWMTPSDLREGAFGWWEEAQGAQRSNAAPPPAHPFSIRCRIFLDDVPGRLP